MEFKTLRRNLQAVLQVTGTLNMDQLKRFFRNSPEADRIPFYIRELLNLHLADYDSKRNTITWHGFPALKDEVVRRRQLAFWAVAYFGEENVREILSLEYPSQLFFITENNECYDLTVCVSPSEAKVATRIFRLYQGPDGDDDVNHIAIVRNHEMGQAVLNAGCVPFDSYCIYDDNHIPFYYTHQGDTNGS